MPSFVYDAGAQIVAQVALVLAGYCAEAQTDAFACEHAELSEVADLLERAKRCKEDFYSDTEILQAWLADVAAILPQLWD